MASDPQPPRSAFADQLKRWRRLRRLSQLELALQANVSQKHISYLELARAKPSRAMVLQLAQVLDLPLHERNVLLESAGYSAAFSRSSLDDPVMRPVVEAVEVMLTHLDPSPALVVDGAWNVIRANAGMRRLMAALAFRRAPLAQAVGEAAAGNMMRQLFHPAGLRTRIANWAEIAPFLLAHLRRQQTARPSEALGALLAELATYPGVADLPPASASGALPPITPIEFRHEAFRLRLLSMCSIFGNPQDITTDQLRIESFFPADDEARRTLQALREAGQREPVASSTESG